MTEGAFRNAVEQLDFDEFLTAAQLDEKSLEALHTWRGTINL